MWHIRRTNSEWGTLCKTNSEENLILQQARISTWASTVLVLKNIMTFQRNRIMILPMSVGKLECCLHMNLSTLEKFCWKEESHKNIQCWIKKEKFITLTSIYSLRSSWTDVISLRGKKIDVWMFCNILNKILRRSSRFCWGVINSC